MGRGSGGRRLIVWGGQLCGAALPEPPPNPCLSGKLQTGEIIGEISKKVAQIQNAGLGEFRIRDLNDEINKLLREKGHWEFRIKELGGPDYARIGPKMLDHEGKEVPGNRGYKYFGAAKDLPGVRELFEKEPLPPPRKTRAELMKSIDAEYYGYRDEDDGILEPLEQEHEKKGVWDPEPAEINPRRSADGL
ncbi:PREDICTED: pre-mRNA-splicing factor ISY1 homolog [Calidris pugnax]|uniref:pre-mRNA-splicing factor ISY1 homolog n=1 Tax=Calidris pugnax TaxID=198806 RepID=UPI00071C913C|nr:PREDICTED: pre-mRNA-splicing factor ISY1 homolog [Calidris pugnax]